MCLILFRFRIVIGTRVESISIVTKVSTSGNVAGSNIGGLFLNQVKCKPLMDPGWEHLAHDSSHIVQDE